MLVELDEDGADDGADPAAGQQHGHRLVNVRQLIGNDIARPDAVRRHCRRKLVDTGVELSIGQPARGT